MVEEAFAFRRRGEILPSGGLTKMTQATLDPVARALEKIDIRIVLWVVTALCLESQGLYKMEGIWDGLFAAGFSIQEAVDLALNMQKYMSSLRKSGLKREKRRAEPATRPLQEVSGFFAFCLLRLHCVTPAGRDCRGSLHSSDWRVIILMREVVFCTAGILSPIRAPAL